MADPRLRLGRDPAFDPFLGANVGKDRNGASVTVLSMLARLGVDPWEEASALAGMADTPARNRLGVLLSCFHDVPSPISGTSATASDLVARLPKQASTARPDGGGGTKLTLPPFGAPIYWIIAAAIFVAWFAAIARGQ